MCTSLYAGLPENIQMFFASHLTSGTISVVILGLLFKIGIPSHRTISLGASPAANTAKLLTECGRLWILDRTQMLQILHLLQALLRALPENAQPSSLTLTLKNSSGIIEARLAVPGEMGDDLLKTVRHYPATVNVETDATGTDDRARYLLV